MTDNDIADRLVALGIIKAFPLRYELSKIAVLTTAHSLVRDWRVAGEVMELLGDVFSITRVGDILSMSRLCGDADVIAESLPRAIIEACLKLLEE